MTKGIVYLLYGMKVAERLVVSIWSLRKHYSGKITVLCGGEAECRLAAVIGHDVDVLRFDPSGLNDWKDHDSDRAVFTKTLIPRLTPYDDTVYLDADTLIVGGIEELFGYDVLLTRVNVWTCGTFIPKKRMEEWRGINLWIDRLIDEQITERRKWPLINTGVFGFRKGNPDMDKWRELAECNSRIRSSDQTAMQLLTSVIKHRVLDERFNRTPRLGRVKDDIRIWHFNGACHCSGKSNRSEIWIPFFDGACRDGIADLKEWAGNYDWRVREYMNRNEAVK